MLRIGMKIDYTQFFKDLGILEELNDYFHRETEAYKEKSTGKKERFV